MGSNADLSIEFTGDYDMADESHLIINRQGPVTIVGFDQSVILDTYHIDQVSKQLFGLIDDQNSRRIILDFATIKMLSSQTLGVLIKMKRKLDELGGKMVISGIDPRLYRVFKVTNLQSIFEFFENNNAAITALSD
jgi:anti-sigma B factor antagonist